MLAVKNMFLSLVGTLCFVYSMLFLETLDFRKIFLYISLHMLLKA